MRLKHLSPIARGSFRDIYQHPDDERLLVKVLGPQAFRKGKGMRWYKPWRQFVAQRTLRRELREYRSLEKRGLGDLPFLQKFHGMVETDIGRGVVVEKLTGPEGKLAPTVMSIVMQRGLSEDLRCRIWELREQVVRYAVVFMDVSGNNIVLAGGPDNPRMVVIDGLGDRLLIRVNSMSAAINRINSARYFERAIRKLEAIDPHRQA